jgi:prepilin-type N-terminal cleavage/methylation domain-containing protein
MAKAISSVPARSSERGFSLLELQVSMLLLSLAALGIFKLVVAHEQLASRMEEWCVGEPTLYLEPSASSFERILGFPAAALSTEGTVGNADPPGIPVNEVFVLAAQATLYPPGASATVRVEAVQP